MKLVIKEIFKNDYISRVAGEKLRHMILDLWNKNEKVVLDFSGLMVASTSFFDEGVAKMAQEKINPVFLKTHLSFENLYPRDKELLEKMCQIRGSQLK